MILVVGATGFLGMAICRRLTDRGLPVRALVRPTSDAGMVDHLRGLRAALVVGDLRDRYSLDIACQGIETVITTATIMMAGQPGDTIQNVDQAGQISLVDAAKAAGVKHFVYISYSKNLGTDCPLTTAKRTVEQYLMQSGLTYTILRPSYFMEVWLDPIVGFDYPNAKTTIYGDGHNQLSWISRGDVAAFTVAALANPTTLNVILELGGPEALSPLEVVKIFEEVNGRQFEVQHVSVEVLGAQKARATDSVQQSFAALMIDYAKGDIIDMSMTAKMPSLRFMMVKEYARRVLVPTH